MKLSRAKSGMRANKALDTGEHACALLILDVSEARWGNELSAAFEIITARLHYQVAIYSPSGKSESPALASTEGASFLCSSPNMTTE